MIMNQTDYDQKAKALLNTDAYVTVKTDPTKTLQGRVQREWRAMKAKYAIPQHTYFKGTLSPPNKASMTDGPTPTQLR